ncbi:MAG: Cbb3-type cytochrome oxidase component FixQ [Pseudomonadota bacterium]|jgi:cbb3-type cytochrome oxidase subunit 3
MSDLHAALTVLFFLVFIGIVVYVYSKGQKKQMEEAAQIPLRDDEPVGALNTTKTHEG